MNKPKYKLGDIIYDRLCDSTELIVSIENAYYGVEYGIVVIEGSDDGMRYEFFEPTLDNWYVVIGNILEAKQC